MFCETFSDSLDAFRSHALPPWHVESTSQDFTQLLFTYFNSCYLPGQTVSNSEGRDRRLQVVAGSEIFQVTLSIHHKMFPQHLSTLGPELGA